MWEARSCCADAPRFSSIGGKTARFTGSFRLSRLILRGPCVQLHFAPKMLDGVSSFMVIQWNLKTIPTMLQGGPLESLIHPVITDARLEGWRIEPSSLSNCTPARCLYFCCSLVPSGPPPIFFSSVRTYICREFGDADKLSSRYRRVS